MYYLCSENASRPTIIYIMHIILYYYFNIIIYYICTIVCICMLRVHLCTQDSKTLIKKSQIKVS